MLKGHAENAVRFGESLVNVSPCKGKRLATDEIASLVNMRRAFRNCLPCVNDKRQDLVLHFDQARSVLRQILIVRCDRSHLIAHIANCRIQNRNIGSQPSWRHIEWCQNRMNARNTFYRRNVDFGYARMRVWTANDLAMQHPRQVNVARVLRFAGELSRQVMPWNRSAYYRISRHRFTAACFTDSMMRP